MVADQRLQQWLEALREPDAEMSKIAADKLGEMRRPEAVPALVEAMERRTALVAAAAAQALGRIGDTRALAPLLKALVSHKDIVVQTAAAEALGIMHARDAVPTLKQVVQDYLDTYKTDHYSKTRSFRRGLFTTCIEALKAIGTRDAIRFAEKAESYSRSM